MATVARNVFSSYISDGYDEFSWKRIRWRIRCPLFEFHKYLAVHLFDDQYSVDADGND